MVGADGMIDAGERTGAWPVSLESEELFTSSGLKAPRTGLRAMYRSHDPACVGVVGDRYRATTPHGWRDLMRAAVAAGARPTGAFSLREGSRVLATFEVGVSNGLRTQLLVADAFDGSMKLTCGTTSVRVVCANTLSRALSTDGSAMAALLHTASLETKVNALTASIGDAVKHGETVRAAYEAAEKTAMFRHEADKVFDLLFPEAPEGSTGRTRTIADNARQEARAAAAMPINNCGPTVATLWNAATYLVDRRGDGSTRETRGGDMLDSMLFGARARRVEEIQTIIEVIMRDGTVRPMCAAKAVEEGVDRQIVGRKILEGMLADLSA